jgi:hypothetical protein
LGAVTAHVVPRDPTRAAEIDALQCQESPFIATLARAPPASTLARDNLDAWERSRLQSLTEIKEPLGALS